MIDTHLHLWELSRGWYGWNTPVLGPVHDDSTIDDVADAMAASRVDTVIAVQAADSVAETEWLLGLADRHPNIRGVVAYLPVDDFSATERALMRYSDRALVGCRQLWHNHHRSDELAGPDTLRSLGLLGDAGLSVDIPDAFPRLWPALTVAVTRLPGTRFVLDHCGKPPFGDPSLWPAWEAAFTDLARRPNVFTKLSGLFGGSGSAHPATELELARVVHLTRTAAGAERTMVGSDWPMTRGRVDYPTTVARLEDLLSPWTEDERQTTLGETARTAYELTDNRS